MFHKKHRSNGQKKQKQTQLSWKRFLLVYSNLYPPFLDRQIYIFIFQPKATCKIFVTLVNILLFTNESNVIFCSQSKISLYFIFITMEIELFLYIYSCKLFGHEISSLARICGNKRETERGVRVCLLDFLSFVMMLIVNWCW